MGSLQGKRALITGAGTGIGRQLALDLAGAGAEVAICGRRRGPLDETARLAGGGIDAHTADLADPDEAFRLADAVGPVDILVNNAGFSSVVRSTRYVGPEEWRAVMDVNTLGPAMLTRALLPPMIEKEAPAVEPGLVVEALEYPPARPEGRIVGEGTDAVPELLRLLREEAKVI